MRHTIANDAANIKANEYYTKITEHLHISTWDQIQELRIHTISVCLCEQAEAFVVPLNGKHNIVVPMFVKVWSPLD